VDHVGCSRETEELTPNGIDDGNAKMPMALQTQRMKNPDLQGECLAHGFQHHDQQGIHNPKKSGLEMDADS
jgi:hypothetical protein